jgi:tetratricopeptide (TPR) repeat protein
MKRIVFGLLLLVLAGLAVFLAYGTAAREAEYRRLIADGQAALTADQTFVAIEAFSGAVALRGDSMLPFLKRGETYRRRGELSAALRDLRTAARLDPTATRPLDELGDVNYAMERYARAAESYEASLKLDEQAPRVLYKLALARMRLGRPDAAISALRQAVGQVERFPEAHFLLGVCLAETNHLGEAVAAFERSVQLSPGQVAPREELARLFERMKRPQDAIQQLEALAALDPTAPGRLVAVSLAYARQGRTDMAVMKLGQAAERFPEEDGVYVALARIWLEAAEGRHDRVALSKALEALERVETGASATSEALTLLGRALLESGDPAGACRALESATAKRPADPTAFEYLATGALRLGRVADARSALVAYTAVAEEGPRVADVALEIADLSTRLGETDEAVRWLRRAVDASDDSPAMLARLAAAHLRAGALDAARVTIARGLDKDPTNPALLALSRRVKTP